MRGVNALLKCASYGSTTGYTIAKLRDSTWTKTVVGMQEKQNVATGGTGTEVQLSATPRAALKRAAVGAFEGFPTTIGAAAVNGNDLVGAARQRVPNGVGHRLALVEHGDHDRDADRKIGHAGNSLIRGDEGSQVDTQNAASNTSAMHRQRFDINLGGSPPAA
ncbi:MAG: hypothetical protein R3C10_21555 [Pirellulales bacterium]